MVHSVKEKNFSRYHLDSQTLYFLHPPKAAGTTLITILDRYFSPDSILKAHSWNELLPQMPLDFSKYQFVRGHFGYSITKLFPKKPICITMVRDPVKLMISAYKMLSRQPEDIERFHIPRDKNLSELIEGPYLEGLKNPQTHWLVIEQDILARTKGLSKNQLEEYRPEEDEGLLPKYSYEKFLKIAKKRISEFAFVGIVEKMEESLFLLHYTFGWKPIRNTVKENVALDTNGKLSDQAIEKLSKITKIDQKLYKFATNIFEKKYSIMIKNLKEKYYEPNFEKLKPNDAVFEMLKRDYLENKVRS